MKIFLCLICFLLITFLFSGCAVAGDIFNAGVWIGMIIVLAVFVLLVVLIRKGTGGS